MRKAHALCKCWPARWQSRLRRSNPTSLGPLPTRVGGLHQLHRNVSQLRRLEPVCTDAVLEPQVCRGDRVVVSVWDEAEAVQDLGLSLIAHRSNGLVVLE